MGFSRKSPSIAKLIARIRAGEHNLLELSTKRILEECPDIVAEYELENATLFNSYWSGLQRTLRKEVLPANDGTTTTTNNHSSNSNNSSSMNQAAQASNGETLSDPLEQAKVDWELFTTPAIYLQENGFSSVMDLNDPHTERDLYHDIQGSTRAEASTRLQEFSSVVNQAKVQFQYMKLTSTLDITKQEQYLAEQQAHVDNLKRQLSELKDRDSKLDAMYSKIESANTVVANAKRVLDGELAVPSKIEKMEQM